MQSRTSGQIRHLYAHIPFCPVKCPYCAFVTHVGSRRLMEPYVDALLVELERRAASVSGPLRTVYFGGGTPSMLPPALIARILTRIGQLLGSDAAAERTLEAHPGTVKPGLLEGYLNAGINRLSIGAESFNGAILARIGRSHRVDEVTAAMQAARDVGFESINLDLMYGLPGQTLPGWRETLERAMELKPEHLSLYPLSIEPGTVFNRRRASLELPADESVAEMYGVACNTLRSAGFAHYEVANWARPGRRSIHNLAYWRAERYLAVGVGAHGYVGDIRYINTRGVSRYIAAIGAGQNATAGRERIDRAIELDEYLILRLRLLEDGVQLDELRRRFGPAAAAAALRAAARTRGAVSVRNGRLILGEDAALLGNEVWAEFTGLHDATSPIPQDLVS